jgi:hypothetical protein
MQTEAHTIQTTRKTATTPPPAAPAASLRALAESYLRAAEGDTVKAVARLTARLVEDRATLARLLSDIIREAAGVVVEERLRHERASIIEAARANAGPSGMTKARAEAKARVFAQMLLDFPLANGLRLRDATRADVLAQAENYAAIAADTRVKAVWLRAVAEATPEGVTVGSALSEARVAELFQEANNA